MHEDTVVRYYRIEKRDISYLRYILEGHEGVANTTTVEGTSDVIMLQIAPDFVETAGVILDSLKNDEALFIYELCGEDLP